MFLTYSYNQFDIWVNLFRSLEMFIREISDFTSNIITICDDTTIQLNNAYTLEQQNNILRQNFYLHKVLKKRNIYITTIGL